jgi:hypothetical protein
MAVRDRVGESRRRIRGRGLRPLQVWVPDVRTETFAAEAHRQPSLVAGVDVNNDDQEFVEEHCAVVASDENSWGAVQYGILCW